MFIGKQGELIALVANTREELENNKFMKFDTIEETDVNYQLYGGSYLTPEEVEQREQEAVNHLTMTALDMITAIKSMGVTDEQIEQFLASNLTIKHQLQFCQNVYCGVAKSFCPITIGNITILPENMEHLFKVKNGVE